MQHTCHWYCRSKTVASARMLARHKTAYVQLLASVDPRPARLMAPLLVPEHGTRKRPHCATCLRPQSACICPWITPLVHQVEVLILQHPLEVDNAKGTARLLQLSLPHSRLLIGEVFDPQLLTDSPKHQLLLYPETANEQALGLPAPPVLDPACLSDPRSCA